MYIEVMRTEVPFRRQKWTPECPCAEIRHIYDLNYWFDHFVLTEGGLLLPKAVGHHNLLNMEGRSSVCAPGLVGSRNTKQLLTERNILLLMDDEGYFIDGDTVLEE